MYDFFCAYAGALYISNGRSTRPVVEEWIIQLIEASPDAAIDTHQESPDLSIPPPTYSSNSRPLPGPPTQRTPSASSLETPPASPTITLMSTHRSPNGSISYVDLLEKMVVTRKGKTGGTVAYKDNQEGRDHDPQWIVRCIVNGQEKGAGKGEKKKLAKEIAARQACQALNLRFG